MELLVRMVFRVQTVAVPLLDLLEALDLLVVVDSRGLTFSQDHTFRTDHLEEIEEADANATVVGPVLGEVQSRVGKVGRVAQDSKAEQVISQELTALVDLAVAADQVAAAVAEATAVLVVEAAAVALAVPLVTMALAESAVS